MKNVSYTRTCSNCNGTGKTTYNDTDGMEHEGSCGYCNGKGRRTLELKKSDETCENCSGKGRVDFARYEHSKTLFGTPTRTYREGKEECPCCLGTGKTHYEWKMRSCGTCWGHGVVKTWVKAFFGGEKEAIVTCPTCNGRKELEDVSSLTFSGF